MVEEGGGDRSVTFLPRQLHLCLFGYSGGMRLSLSDLHIFEPLLRLGGTTFLLVNF